CWANVYAASRGAPAGSPRLHTFRGGSYALAPLSSSVPAAICRDVRDLHRRLWAAGGNSGGRGDRSDGLRGSPTDQQGVPARAGSGSRRSACEMAGSVAQGVVDTIVRGWITSPRS